MVTYPLCLENSGYLGSDLRDEWLEVFKVGTVSHLANKPHSIVTKSDVCLCEIWNLLVITHVVNGSLDELR